MGEGGNSMKYIKLTSFILAVMLISGCGNTDLLYEVYEMRYAETIWEAES